MAKPKPFPLAMLSRTLQKKVYVGRGEAHACRRPVGGPGTRDQRQAVRLPGLATFTGVDVPERQVRNPATGGMQTAAATRQVRFAAAGPFKTTVKEATV